MLARLVSVELVDKCLRAMKLGKTAGVDNIETEHLHYAHLRLSITVDYIQLHDGTW